jgi:hypothetical protein
VVACESLLIANFTPYWRARRMCSSGRSSRSGNALISSAVPVRAAGLEDFVQVGVERRTVADPSGQRVADDRHVRVFAGADQPAGHVALGLVEVRVHGCDTEVESCEEVRWPVHAAVRADVEFGAV